jgi:acyl-CoA thioesterase-1
MVTRTISRVITGIGTATLTLLLVGCGQPTDSDPTVSLTSEVTKPGGTIVAMGDSLTEGLGVNESEAYPALLEQKLRTDGYTYQVINAGISGETSTGALSRVDWILNLEPDIVILETGGNDGLRAIDPELTHKNISAIVDQFQANDTDVVLAGMETIQNLGQEYTTAYAEIYPTVAADKDIILIPFFLEGVAAKPELNQADGIHPTAEGYQVILETVYPYVITAIEQREQAP